MTQDTKHAPLRAALPAATLAALLLAGCSSGHIGESWQCPLAKGGSCDSVAAADPAVPDADTAQEMALRRPLYLVPDAATDEPASPAARCDAACDGGFDPFAWLARLFEGGGSGRTTTPDNAVLEPEARSAVSVGEAAAQTAEPGTAALPAEPLVAEVRAGGGDPHAGELRTGEIVARIWIAPFVDADGVYREASHIRVVLEPAGWRLK